jgi:F-type H+-transporting ATPase subunit epsilon
MAGLATRLLAELVSPERIVFSGEVRSVLLPAADGEMTVLTGHVPLVALLHAGIVFATDAAGTGRRAYVSGGLAEISIEGAATRLTILAERVSAVEEMTGDRIEAEIEEIRLERDSSADLDHRARCDVSISRLEEIGASLKL